MNQMTEPHSLLDGESKYNILIYFVPYGRNNRNFNSWAILSK